jgi:hypothetical protein
MQGMRIVFVFDERDRLRSVRALVRGVHELVASASFLARIAPAVQPDSSNAVSTAVDTGDAHGK